MGRTVRYLVVTGLLVSLVIAMLTVRSVSAGGNDDDLTPQVVAVVSDDINTTAEAIDEDNDDLNDETADESTVVPAMTATDDDTDVWPIDTNDSTTAMVSSAQDMTANESLTDVHTVNTAAAETKVNCTPVNTILAVGTDNETQINQTQVIIVNATRLSQYLESKPNISQSTGADCALVIFYYNWCPFSARYAPHLNALARIFPQFHVLAIDAYGLNSVNMRYGLVGVPTVLFFHNGKVVGKVNDTDPTIESFAIYITQLTGISPVLPTNVTDDDLLGPLSSTPEPHFDYLLLFSWIFAWICFSYLFAKSNLFKTTLEAVRNNWREAEAQHEHID
ncbi:thioredoxin domain-containing protein 15-like [Oppia nitens]|uniref:thioredoxin domain-containing protein 15-like n=1 Tax=Oppia nitens TaxID=1686743 RepID=UPI0023DC5C4D|nr:thioredoxin domain-containing protein 15-like [Oppia nitens]